jgi:hypothetical protein
VEATPESAAAALRSAGVAEWTSTSVEDGADGPILAVGVTAATQKVVEAVRAALAPLAVRIYVEARPQRY